MKEQKEINEKQSKPSWSTYPLQSVCAHPPNSLRNLMSYRGARTTKTPIPYLYAYIDRRLLLSKHSLKSASTVNQSDFRVGLSELWSGGTPGERQACRLPSEWK